MPTRPSMRRPPAGSTKDSRSVSAFSVTGRTALTRPKRDMDDIAARRQHDIRRRAAFLADQLEGAGLVRPVGKHPPHQPAADDRQVLAVARRQRQHGLAGASMRRGGGGATGGDGGDGRLRQRRGQARASMPGRKAAPDSSPVPMALRDRCRRHRRRPVGEHLGRSRSGNRASQHAPAKRKRRQQASAPPGSIDAVTP